MESSLYSILGKRGVMIGSRCTVVKPYGEDGDPCAI